MSSFSVREEPDGLVVRVDDSVGLNDFRSTTFRDTLYEVVLNHDGIRLALDLGPIDDFLSSSGIATLVGLKRRVDAQHGKLILFQARPNLLESLRITHLVDYFAFAVDEPAALALLRPLPAV
jgi:anti-sigma B factor antagonist